MAAKIGVNNNIGNALGISNLLILVLAASTGFGALYFFKNSHGLWSKETNPPPYATSYSVAPLSCRQQPDGETEIKFIFTSVEAAEKQTPKFSIQEYRAEAKTEIIFQNVSSITKEFDFSEIVANPLIDSIDYFIKDRNFVVDIYRKGAYIPAKIERRGAIATVFLAQGDETYPLVFDQRPGNQSAAFPSLRTLSFKAGLKDPLKNAVVLFQGSPVEINATTTEDFVYGFQFKENIEKDKEYYVKAIVTDLRDRTFVGSWMFKGEIPVEGILGPSRFKYLGWWGEINTDEISVRSGPNSAFKKIGTLSSINRVKVVKEVFGEMINEVNLWYQIDGGKYPHAYVFSDYVTPMVQPGPPTDFAVPEGVAAGEKWIDVDLGKKVLTLFDYDKPIFATYISPGREENPTVEGTFRVWYKLKKTEMQGGPPLHSYRYDLKDIPWTMFYNEDYAIHGVYWHDNFGTPQSAGCTNMTQGDAEYIFEKTLPVIPEGREAVFSKETNPGTVVHNH
jgi:lipoprotein-anchoring transpeptidase ErfK/SrfK